MFAPALRMAAGKATGGAMRDAPVKAHLDLHEDDDTDGAQLADWIMQASKLPGGKL
jgi:hypothetical protein